MEIINVRNQQDATFYAIY